MAALITLKSKNEIEKMRKAGILLATIHQELKEMIKPGITTLEIDAWVEKYMADHGATPEPVSYTHLTLPTMAVV